MLAAREICRDPALTDALACIAMAFFFFELIAPVKFKIRNEIRDRMSTLETT